MITPELISFIKSERAKGVSDETIKAKLLTQGWTEHDVQEAVAAISSGKKIRTSPEVKAYRRQKKWLAFFVGLSVFILYAVLLGGGGLNMIVAQLFSAMGLVTIFSVALGSYLSALIVSSTMSPSKTSGMEMVKTITLVLGTLFLTIFISFGIFFVTCLFVALPLGLLNGI